MTVRLKPNLQADIEPLVPSDRVVSVYNGYVSLYDTQIQVTEDMIEEIIDDQ